MLAAVPLDKATDIVQKLRVAGFPSAAVIGYVIESPADVLNYTTGELDTCKINDSIIALQL